MTFNYNSNYFFKLADFIINAKPGVYNVSEFTKEPDKFRDHISWFNTCRPEHFNYVKFISDTQFEIVKNDNNRAES